MLFCQTGKLTRMLLSGPADGAPVGGGAVHVGHSLDCAGRHPHHFGYPVPLCAVVTAANTASRKHVSRVSHHVSQVTKLRQ